MEWLKGVGSNKIVNTIVIILLSAVFYRIISRIGKKITDNVKKRRGRKRQNNRCYARKCSKIYIFNYHIFGIIANKWN